MDLAAMVAKIAAYAIFSHGFIKHGFFHSILKDLLENEMGDTSTFLPGSHLPVSTTI